MMGSPGAATEQMWECRVDVGPTRGVETQAWTLTVYSDVEML